VGLYLIIFETNTVSLKCISYRVDCKSYI